MQPNSFDPNYLNRDSILGYEVLQLLCPPAGDRFSKVEAFCYLLSLARNGERDMKKGDHDVKLLPGQFCSSITTLSTVFNWQRNVTRAFLERLSDLGQIEMTPYVKSYIFTIKSQTRIYLNLSSVDDILDFCFLQYGRLLKQHENAETVSGSFLYYFSLLSDPFTSQVEVFDEIVARFIMGENSGHGKDDLLSDALFTLFGRDRIWEWIHVLDSLSLLSRSLKSGKKPSSINDLPMVGRAQLVLLDMVYDFYGNPSAGATSLK